MLFFYVRHGEPIYNPDSLTPLGERQAEAIGKRLSIHGIDKVFTSTSTRAIQTGQPLCDILRLTPERLDFAHEDHAFRDFSAVNDEGRRTWSFFIPRYIDAFTSPDVRALGDRWFDHPEFKNDNFEAGMKRVYDEADAFFASLGYEHERYTGRYKITKPNDDRIAMFAHSGFGCAFMSAILDIPYPQVAIHFEMQHSGLTVIDFRSKGEYAVPVVLTYSNDGHLYKEGLPTRYNGSKRIVY